MSEVLTPSQKEVTTPAKPAIEPGAATAQAQPEKSALGVTPPVESAKPPLPPNPESAWKAFGKGVVDATATFAVAATTPMQNGEHPPLQQVELFDKPKEQNLTIPDALRETFRQQTAEQMLGLRAGKTETPGRTRGEEPQKQAALERRAENTKQQNLTIVRSQLAQAQTPLAKAA